MLSLATGHDVGYLTGQVAGGREGYYTGAVATGEPPGVWYGAGAEALGLRGEVDADLMEAVYQRMLDPRDPRTHNRATRADADTLGAPHRAYQDAEALYGTYLANETTPPGPERRAELWAAAERNARQAVAFIDATFSVQKSITVLAVAFERAETLARARGRLEEAEAWARMRQTVEEAALVGARAAVDFLAKEAGYSRVGKHGGGAGRWIDAHQLVVAQFLQHDSRNRDPQLHVHQAILNRVLCSDGEWRTLDSRAIHEMRGGAAAVGELACEAYLTQTLGVRFEVRPDGKAREVVGVPQELIDLFSSRRRAITGKLAELRQAYVERFGRDPVPAVLTRMAQQATLATRQAKSHGGETDAQRLDRWDRETRSQVAGGLTTLAYSIVADRSDVDPARFDPDAVCERAVAAIGEKRGTWGRSDLMREIAAALPANLGVDPARIPALLETLTEKALRTVRSTKPTPEGAAPTPASLQLANGRSVYESPTGGRYVSPGHLSAELSLRAAAVRRGAFALPMETANALVDRFAQAGCELGADQAAAVRGVLTSGAQVEVMAAAAGAGKSFVVGAIAEAFAANHRHVFGLAPSQVAADVLADEGVTAANVERWIRTQVRIQEGREREGDSQFRLQPGDLVVVDEAGMASTHDLVEIHRRCEEAGAKLLLVGDPHQLGAVGPGGALSDLSQHGLRYELTEVRRFVNRWERTASLGLRTGDVAALDEYQKRGRLLSSGTTEQAEQAALRAWLADTIAGRQSVLIVSTNEAAARLSAAARAELVRMGRLDADAPGVELRRDGNTASAGDLVQARRNNWDLPGRAAINRSTYRVETVAADGSMVVRPILGYENGAEVHGAAMALPADYVQANLTLGYASTVHAAQGRTLDTCHAVIDKAITAAAAYVALTRGKLANFAHVVTRAANTDNPAGEAQTVEPRAARAVLGDLLERGGHDISALQEIEQETETARSVLGQAGRLFDAVSRLTCGRTSADLDLMVAEGVLTEEDRVRLAADDATGAVDRILRAAELAGHDRSQVLRDALASGDLKGTRSAGQALYSRIQNRVKDAITPAVAAFRDLIPREVPDELREWLEERADAADDRRRELGARVAEEAPPWAVEALGPVPEGVLERTEWEHKAGWAAAYREMAGHDDDTDALGSAPPAGLADKYAIWRTAHQALDLSDAGADEREMSPGQLRNRVQAYEREKVWAPRYVADELAETQRTRQARLVDAELWTARAAQLEADNPAEAAALRDAADTARREAEKLEGVAADLEEADQARARWYAATATTRELAERGRHELGARGVDLGDDTGKVTAEEWLAAHDQAQAEQEHRWNLREAFARQMATVRDIADKAVSWIRPAGQQEVEQQQEETRVELLEQTDELHPAAEVEEAVELVAPVDAAVEDTAGEEMAAAYLDDLDDLYPPVVEVTEEVGEPADADQLPPPQVWDGQVTELETDVPDIRDTAVQDVTEDADPTPRDRVPPVDEARQAVERARDAIAEVTNRDALDQRADRRRDADEHDVDDDPVYVVDLRDDAEVDS